MGRSNDVIVLWILPYATGLALRRRFGHFTFLVRFLATNRTIADLIFQHRIIGGTGTPEFFAHDNLPDIDQCKTDEEDGENDANGI